MQQKGFCRNCLNKVILIEKDTTLDPRWKSTGLSKAETREIVFKDYWEEVNDREHLELIYLEEARVMLNRKLDCNRENSEKFPDDHKSDANLFAENAANEKTIPFDSKGKQNANTSMKKSKSNKKTCIEWGSKELIEFLASFGEDTSKSLDEDEIIGVIMRYIKEKKLLKNNKKKTFSCDGKLYRLFGRRNMCCKSIGKFLAVHLAANATSEDEIFNGSEEDNVPVTEKKTCFDDAEQEGNESEVAANSSSQGNTGEN
ncbi:hypothetical protein HU200_065219 [Digitaria exilis]|uniref:DM2 domain-containing protein n=1 Tax=Digitaria exilis TaxID=1010633 RepID=A0A835DXZ3_9POAL|nr:hypothetical protein HU200_065219 [Digitaria exilis]